MGDIASATAPVTDTGSPRTVAAAGQDVFDAALNGACTRLGLDDGRTLRMPAHRWRAPADGADQWLLGRCHGPTVDLGCGPGRLVEALQRNGIAALGVDCSMIAVRHCRARGSAVLHRDVFAPLPAEGFWAHVLLADGNIGIGGDPVAMLRRAASLLAPGGTVLVETGPRRNALWRGRARLHDPHHDTGPWFPWATLGLNALPELARQAGLHLTGARVGHHRCFAQLAHLPDDPHAGYRHSPDQRFG